MLQAQHIDNKLADFELSHQYFKKPWMIKPAISTNQIDLRPVFSRPLCRQDNQIVAKVRLINFGSLAVISTISSSIAQNSSPPPLYYRITGCSSCGNYQCIPLTLFEIYLILAVSILMVAPKEIYSSLIRFTHKRRISNEVQFNTLKHSETIKHYKLI
ncbi:hypothetical protein BD408DRAFT_426042 [Parasitella parasitica]|nr:hypothetical protein BD408DRAFT_426042 [Parasitella parasitica]